MQKLITAIALLLMFSSCNNDSKSALAGHRITVEGLKRSNSIILDQTICHLKSLDIKLWDARVQVQAEIWQPVSVKVHDVSSELVKYLDTLKAELTKENLSGAFFDEADYNSVQKIFSVNKKGEELFRKLKKYETDLSLINPRLKSYLENNALLSIDFEASDKQNFTSNYLKDIPAIAALALLLNIENQVRKLEYNGVSMCDNLCSSISCDFSGNFTAIVSQSSSNVIPGGIIEVSAGIGAFSSAAQPRVMINGKNIEVNDKAVAICNIKANADPGVYKVPVIIEFTKPDGQKQTYSKVVSYTVNK